MPGIAGFINGTSTPRSVDELQTMVRTLCHDADTRSGHLSFEGLSAAAGWAVRPRSFADCMPAWNREKTICLLFAGEDFSSLDGAASQDQGNRPWRADALLDRYEKHGTDFLTGLNGWFSGLLVDRRSGDVILFNDRYGLNRIYYCESNGEFAFSSEAKSLLAIRPQLRRLDQRGLAEYFSVGCVLQNRTLFDGVFLLPPASCWTFHRDGRIEKRRYFDPSAWEQQPRLDAITYSERLTETFARIAPRYLKGDEPVAMSLTGGLDSRMMLAWAKVAPGRLACYTFAGPYRDCADVRIARRLATLCQQPHTTIRVEKPFFDQFDTLAEKTVYLSDGTMDVSGAVELYVNQQARKIAPVRLTGNYGSEILRSNVAFRPGRVDTSLFTPEFRGRLDEARETYRQEAAGHRLSFIAFKQVPWHHYSRMSVEESQLTPRSPFLDNELVALAYQAPSDLTTSADPILDLINRGNRDLGQLATDRALRGRALPVITPLSKMWQEFTVRAEYAYDYGMPQWLARTDGALKAMHLERLFLGRHKFYHFRVWYRDYLAKSLRNGLLSPHQPSCYADGVADRLVREHTDGRANHTSDLHRLLAVQLIERLFIASSCRT